MENLIRRKTMRAGINWWMDLRAHRVLCGHIGFEFIPIYWLKCTPKCHYVLHRIRHRGLDRYSLFVERRHTIPCFVYSLASYFCHEKELSVVRLSPCITRLRHYFTIWAFIYVCSSNIELLCDSNAFQPYRLLSDTMQYDAIRFPCIANIYKYIWYVYMWREINDRWYIDWLERY